MAAAAAAAADRVPDVELPPLDPNEVSARQFRNRRKVIIRGLPADVSKQVGSEVGPGGGSGAYRGLRGGSEACRGLRGLREGGGIKGAVGPEGGSGVSVGT